MRFLIYKFLLSLFILILSVLGGLFYYGYTQFQATAPLEQARLVNIPKGMGTMMIADVLKSERVITDPYVFVIASRFLPPANTLKAGEYEFPPHIRMQDVISKIKNGDVYKRQFTIPEGLTSYEIIERLRAVPDIQISDVSLPAEGSLLPDTYQYEKNDTLENILKRMAAAQDDVLQLAWADRAKDLQFTTQGEAIILASLVEKETGVPNERARIAGVFVNRLRIGMPLQTDPTVIYALTKGRHKNAGQGPLGRRLLIKDLQIESPYNTYKVRGLPPTPIANPGKDAITATLNPEQHDYLYFVADGLGGHIFARTLDEHNQNVAKWREIQKNNNKTTK